MQTLTERGLSRLGWPGDGSVHAKPVSKLPEAKQVTIAQLEDVKPLLMKSISDDDDDDHDHAEKVTKITITAISTCIFGFPQR